MPTIRDKVIAKIQAGQTVSAKEIEALGGYEEFTKLFDPPKSPPPEPKPRVDKRGRELPPVAPAWAMNLGHLIGWIVISFWIFIFLRTCSIH